MNTVSCPRCNLVTLTTAISCKRCDFVFETVEQTTQIRETSEETPYSETHFTDREQQIFSPFVEAVQPFAALPPPSSQQQNWRQNRQNQYSNYQDCQFAGKKKKIGLAAVSMILGIVGFPPLSVFLGIFVSATLGSILGIAGYIIGAALTLAIIPSGLISGVVALRRVNNRANEYGGKGFAVAGIACSSAGLLILPMVAVIAIPNLTAANRAANEASAISTIQKLAGAEEKYMTSMAGRCGDAQTLFATRLINADLVKGEINGYRFMIINLPAGGCEIHAAPLSASQGTRSFYYATEDKLIRAAKKDGKLAGKTDAPLGSDNDDFSDKKAETKSVKPDESSAIATLRTLQSAQLTYIATAGQGKCGDLQTLANQGLIKQSLADGEDYGYRFILNKLPANNWEITATPISGFSGARSFYINQEGVIRGAVKNGLAAGKGDPPLNL